MNITQKIIKEHLVEGKMVSGEPIEIRIDQTLTQDATGTMAYLQFETMGLSRTHAELSVSYVDHNTLQSGFENPDDHAYLRTIASKYGIIFSKPGNGICHQLHLERFGKPGKTLLGSDSHTPTCGGIGMMAIGAGGLDVAVAMGGGAFQLNMPKVCKVHLTGRLQPWVTAKDVILEVLRRETVKGGVGKVYEYGGPGVKTLSVPERATITNMGAELGATTSIFPSDDITREFLKAQDREEDWKELLPDEGAEYDQVIEINLSELEPLLACPHSPGNVKTIKELEGMKVDQVAIGSCTNSSYKDMKTVSEVLKGKKVNPAVDLGICMGSRQVSGMLSKDGGITDMIASGARTLENVCGPCIGMGFSPKSNGVSLRTFNRNFFGRSGTKTAEVYLVSPEVAVVAAITGEITDPRKFGRYPEVKIPEKFMIDDSMFLKPSDKPEEVEIIRGPNIAPCPAAGEISETIEGEILIKVGDDITTDHIMPAGAKILPLRSNIPKISEHVFEVIDENFHKRAKECNGGFILGGDNYGQGSSREHAALAPMYLGVKAVMVKSFARIHLANLINFGILPLTFVNPEDYNRIEQGDKFIIEQAREQIIAGETVIVKNVTKGFEIEMKHPAKGKSMDILVSGGQLNYTKKRLDNSRR